jgi:hypothetical protein
LTPKIGLLNLKQNCLQSPGKLFFNRLTIQKLNFIPFLLITSQKSRGLYIGKYPPRGGGRKISADVIWGKKIRKGEEKKGENVKEKGRKGKEKGKKGKEKGKKGKENEKRGSKRVK